MATIRGNGSKGHHYYELSVWEESGTGNPSTNKSRIWYNFKLGPIQNSWRWSQMWTMHYTLTINGVDYTGDVPDTYSGSGVVTIVGDTAIDIEHNSDGTKGVSFSFSVRDTSSANYTSGNASADGGYISLETIPRASTPSLSSAALTSGLPVTINTNRASSGFTHTLTYSFGNASGTIGTNVGDSTTWTPPHTLLNQIPNATSGIGTITCTTYSGGTNVGSRSINFTLNAADSIKPTISAGSLAEGNPDISALNWGVHVQSMSYPTISCTASGAYSSTITNYTLKCYSGNTLVSNFSDTSLLLLNNKIVSSFDRNIEYTYKLQVQDSRNRLSDEYPVSFTMTPYTAPSITTGYFAKRTDQNGVDKDDGTYVRCEFKGSIASISNNNPLTVKIGIKQITDTTYTYTTYINGDNTNNMFDFTSTNFKLLSNVDTDYQYNIKYIVSDQFNSVERDILLSTEYMLTDYRNTGHGIAFGKRSEADNMEIAMDIEVTGNINVNGGDYYKDGLPFSGGGGGETLPVGTILEYPVTDDSLVPVGWMICDHRALSRTEYADLFAVIGTTFGAGNGSTTFNIPDKAGLVAVGYKSSDTDFNAIGKTGGVKSVTLTAAQSGLPKHSHGMNGAGGHDHSISGIASRQGGSWNGVVASANTSDRNWSTVSWVGDHTHGIHDAGPNNASEAHTNLQPYNVTNFIIKVTDTTALTAQVMNSYTDSHNNTYSCDYINDHYNGFDGIPYGSIVDYDGDTAPEGYEEVTEGCDIYSTTEVKTDKIWIDNKPIYRKVYKLTGSFSAGYSSSFSISNLNINRATKLEGFAYHPSYGYIDMYFYNGNHSHVHTMNNNTSVNWLVGWDATEVYITIEYTKNS